jgi:PleD family two-component response regulator
MLSVGVAYTASAHTSPDQLVAAADAAMYRAKEARAGLPVLAPMEVG